MKVAYIYPDIISSDPNLTPAKFEPLGFLYIVSSAKHNGFDNYSIFIPENNESLNEFIKKIVKFNPDVMAFSVMTYQVPNAIEILKRTRKALNKKIWGVAGGPHPTIFPGLLLKNGFDACVIGEGEKTFVELLEAISESKYFGEINGIALKTPSGKLITTTQRERLTPDQISFPVRIPSLFIGKGYRGIAYPGPDTKAWASIVASRGCPNNCSFCDAVIMWDRKVKTCSVGYVIKEIAFLNEKYGVHLFHFADLNFTANNRYVIELSKAIISSKLRINWFCMGTLNTLNNTEMLKLMRKAGCSLISVGIESLDDRTLKYIGKSRINLKLNETLGKVQKTGIPVNIYYMIGFPWQTKETLLKELELLKQIEACKIRVSIATPFPKTYFWKDVNKFGIDKDLRLFDTNNLVYNHPSLSREQVKQIQKLFVKEFYFNPYYKRRILDFLSLFPEYKETFKNYWKTLEFREELLKYLGFPKH